MISSQDQGTRPSRSRAAGGRSHVPRRAPELAHLTLDELRSYRDELVTEETRVSYWRRIVQARLDLVIDEDPAALGRLQTVLGEHASYSQRLALLSVHPADCTPPLPDLAILWEQPLGSVDDPDGRALARLAEAERQLSSYRRSLHRRLDSATEDLIARYRENPTLALTALPHWPAAGGVA